MHKSRTLLFVPALLFGFILSAYLSFHEWWDGGALKKAKLAGGQCEDESVHAPKANPNKMLFINCGGYME